MKDMYLRSISRLFASAALGLTAALSALALARAAEDAPSPNVDGVSGILNTPTAEVARDGDAVFTLGRSLVRSVLGRSNVVARSYSVTLGYLPNLEITARLNDYPEVPDEGADLANFQDRSASAKYQFYKDEDWSLAAGVVDFGGESQLETSYYGVATYSGWEDVQLSAGVGTEKFNGAFASARWQPIEQAALLAEYDSQDFNYGLEVEPYHGLTLKAGKANDHGIFTASYRFPLDPRGKDTPCCPVDLKLCDNEYAEPCDMNAAVRDALREESFENVLVGSDGETLFVEFENRRFREELDAVAVATLVAARMAGKGIAEIVVTPKVEDVPQATLSVAVEDLLAYLQDPATDPGVFCVSSYHPGGYPADALFAPEAGKKNGGGQIMLRATSNVDVARNGQPTWRTTAGLGLTEEFYLARGLRAQLRQDWPLFNDITDKTDPVNRDAMLTWLDSWAPDLYTFATTGYYGGEVFGATAEAGYYLEPGRWKLGGRYYYFQDESAGETDGSDGLALADISYFEPCLDWELSLLGGQFNEGDQGIRVESRRFFGPTELTFFAYDTDASEPHGGFRAFVPLPWFSEKRHNKWRADFAPYFGYQYRTDADPNGDIPLAGIDLAAARKRLRPEYIAANLHYFRRAALLYLDSQ
ncbi:YjbH domain-containing protein [bacterium]|nr:YjbH domain-containing protein [bacterium]